MNPLKEIDSSSRNGHRTRTKPTPKKQRVSFFWWFPNARRVSIVGTFNDWQPGAHPLKRGDWGRWLLETALPPGRHEYRFVVDGKWVDDPDLFRSASPGSGSRKTYLVVNA